MIDFYGLTSPNVQKVFIMLEEAGLQYNFKPVDVWASAQHSPEFAKLNPNRKIRRQGNNPIQDTRITCLLYRYGKITCKKRAILEIVLKNFPFAIPEEIDEFQDRSNPYRLGILGINRKLDSSITQKLGKTCSA